MGKVKVKADVSLGCCSPVAVVEVILVVKQTAWLAALGAMLAQHPATRPATRPATAGPPDPVVFVPGNNKQQMTLFGRRVSASLGTGEQ